jgi:hypothetical protein
MQPDAIIDHVRDRAPAIRQIRCGQYFSIIVVTRVPRLTGFTLELLPRNEGKSGAGAETATVATISDIIFEAPHEDPATSRSISSLETPINKQYGHPFPTEPDR